MKKTDFDVLENAEDRILEELASFTDEDDIVKNRVFEMSERKYKEMTSDRQTEQLNENSETEIEIRKKASHRLAKILSAAAAVAIVAGAGKAVYRQTAELKSEPQWIPSAAGTETTGQSFETEKTEQPFIEKITEQTSETAATELPSGTEITEWSAETAITDQSTDEKNTDYIPDYENMKTWFDVYFPVYLSVSYFGTDDISSDFTEKRSILQYVKDKKDSDKEDNERYTEIDGKLYEYKDYYTLNWEGTELEESTEDMEWYKEFFRDMDWYFEDKYNLYLCGTRIGKDIGDAEYITEDVFGSEQPDKNQNIIGIDGMMYIQKTESWPFARCDMNSPVFENYYSESYLSIFGERMYLSEIPEKGNYKLYVYTLNMVTTDEEMSTSHIYKYKIRSAALKTYDVPENTDLSSIDYSVYSGIDEKI